MEVFSESDYRYMARALELARLGWYSTQPNPRVGCVIVKDDEIVGEGFHQQAGEAHAEVVALNSAGRRARGATVYVSLEPCSHVGRTPPCCNALIEAAVSRVIYACEDLNPAVAGQGAAALTEAGVNVQGGLLAGEARQINRGFFKRYEQGRPFVTIKLAMSLDAKIGLKSGESKWITGEEARADVRRLRAQSCAVVTGSGTIRADNPRLTVRDESLATLGRQPRIVILDSQLSLDHAHSVFNTTADCILMHCVEAHTPTAAFSKSKVKTQYVAGSSSNIDLNEVLRYLASLQCNEVLIEAGPTLSSAFFQARLWDELIVYMAPKLIGSSGRDGFALAAIAQLSDSVGVSIDELRHIGPDLRLTIRPL